MKSGGVEREREVRERGVVERERERGGGVSSERGSNEKGAGGSRSKNGLCCSSSKFRVEERGGQVGVPGEVVGREIEGGLGEVGAAKH